ncbi:MAG: hypothetical protein PHX20_02655, partial [Candidatus Omnitrophica bacterium]|nr:hypothetical protein [Candidatus Omnitrophota bacterium]
MTVTGDRKSGFVKKSIRRKLFQPIMLIAEKRKSLSFSPPHFFIRFFPKTSAWDRILIDKIARIALSMMGLSALFIEERPSA